MSGSIQLKGFKELDDQLAQLEQVPAERAAKASLRDAMKPVLEDAQRLVPKVTWSLHDALAITTKGVGKVKGMVDAVAVAGLTIRKLKDARNRPKGTPNPRRYWHLPEFGTSHSAAKPYIRPAFDGRINDMLERVRAALRKRIERAKRKQLSGGAP